MSCTRHRRSPAALLASTLVAVVPAALPVFADEGASALLLHGGGMIDLESGRLVDDRAVLIVGGRVSQVAPAEEVRVPAGARRIDLKGLTLLPGLIDLHSHLLLRPYDQASWDDQVLRESLELRTVRAVAAAKATVEAGFTTLRDLGTEGAGYADVALRDAVAQGIVPGPRIFAATRALVATGCYGPAGFDPRWDVPMGAQVADGVDGVRRATRQQIAAGADWIKVYADYRRRPGVEATPTFSPAELEAIVDEARSAGLPVAAHAVTPEAIRRSVLAGVDTIEHGYGATDEVLALMREHGVVLCPTLTAAESMARYAGWSPGEADPPRIREAKEMFVRAVRSGVTIACGSDVGVFAHGDNARELELMVEYGMTPVEALRAATSTAAAVLKRQGALGCIAPGCVADLIAVRGDPRQDITVLRSPALVVKAGRVVLDRR